MKNRYGRGKFVPVPYTDDELEFLSEEHQRIQEEKAEEHAKQEKELVVEWKSDRCVFIGVHVDEKGAIYVLRDRSFADQSEYEIKNLRRASGQEKRRADVHAVLDNGECCVGLTKERYMLLRARLEKGKE